MKNFSSKTKANFHHSSKRTRYVKLLLASIAAVCVLYFFGSLIGKIGSVISTPVYVVRDWLAESSAILPSYLRSRNELLQEMATLEQKANEQGGKDATIARLAKENEELKSLYGFEGGGRILAEVIVRPPFLPYDALLIDQGASVGVKEGAVVYHASDQAIGYISRVFGGSALVTLFSTPGVRATAYIIGPDVYATLEGQGGGVMQLSVPQGIELKTDAVIVLPSVGGGIIGTVQEVESSPTQPVQYGYVISDVPIQSLKLVSIDTQIPEEITFEEAEAVIRNLKTSQYIINVPDGFIAGGHASGTEATSTVDGVDITEE
jgi:cell shape-determining protein MreC